MQLQELEARLWDCANALRGPIDPSDFKSYIFPLLFWKYISDMWEIEQEVINSKYGDYNDPGIRRDYHSFDLPEESLWKNTVNPRIDINGSKIKIALDNIQNNPEIPELHGIFGDALWGNENKLPFKNLCDLIDILDGINLSNVKHDILGQAYEYLLKQFADESGKKAGEFFTPRCVVRLMVKLLKPKKLDNIYDPACGSGGMLVEAINSAKENNNEDKYYGKIYGKEINSTTQAIARINLYLHKIKEHYISSGNTLGKIEFNVNDDSTEKGKYNIILSNPPFSLKNWCNQGNAWENDPRVLGAVPPKNCGDYAWIQHIIYCMKEKDGKAAVVMPLGTLFRSGAEKKIRKAILDKDILESIILLPDNLFYATGIPACIFILNRNKEDKRKEHLLFIDGSRRCKKENKRNILVEKDIEEIVKVYNENGESNIDDIPCSLIHREELYNNDCDFNISRYIKSKDEEVVLDFDEAYKNYIDVKNKRVDIENKLLGIFKDNGLID